MVTIVPYIIILLLSIKQWSSELIAAFTNTYTGFCLSTKHLLIENSHKFSMDREHDVLQADCAKYNVYVQPSIIKTAGACAGNHSFADIFFLL